MRKDKAMMMDDRMNPKLDEANCNRCGVCITYCPTNAVTMDKGYPVIANEKCTYCGTCEEICPYDAISMAYEIVLSPDLK